MKLWCSVLSWFIGSLYFAQWKLLLNSKSTFKQSLSSNTDINNEKKSTVALCDFLNVGAYLISSRTNQNLFTFVQYDFRCHSGQAEENFDQLTTFLVWLVPNKSFDNINLVGNALWAWALAFTFFMSFEGSSYWFVYPNRGRIFLRENSNGLTVRCR